MSEDPWTEEALKAFNKALSESIEKFIEDMKIDARRAECEIEAVDIESVLSVAPVVEEKQKPRSRSL